MREQSGQSTPARTKLASSTATLSADCNKHVRCRTVQSGRCQFKSRPVRKAGTRPEHLWREISPLIKTPGWDVQLSRTSCNQEWWRSVQVFALSVHFHSKHMMIACINSNLITGSKQLSWNSFYNGHHSELWNDYFIWTSWIQRSSNTVMYYCHGDGQERLSQKKGGIFIMQRSGNTVEYHYWTRISV